MAWKPKTAAEMEWRMKCPGCGTEMKKKDSREKWFCWSCKWSEAGK